MTVRRQINLLKGEPAPDLLPPGLLRNAANNVLSAPKSETSVVLEYGADEGYRPLREAVARWLTNFYAMEVAAERIAISGGASQNLACILQTFTDPVYTRNVWMVAPTYYLACRIMTDAGFDGKLRAVPEDDEGIDTSFLRRALRQSEDQALADGRTSPTIKLPKSWRRIYKHIIYCVPTFSNPTGCVMSLRRREQLVRIAKEFDALVVADDVYDMLQWSSSSGAPFKPMNKALLPRLVDIERHLDGGPSKYGNVCSNGTFSKLVGPGCRTGWVEGTEAFIHGISQTGSTRSGGAPSQLVAALINNMLSTGVLDDHIYHTLQPAYSRRYHRMLKAVERDLLPLGLKLSRTDDEIAGGYFIWLTSTWPLDAEKLSETAAREGLIINAGPRFRVEGDEEHRESQFTNSFRLCFAYEDEDLFDEGMRQLAAIVQRQVNAPSGTSAIQDLF